jgi:transposase
MVIVERPFRGRFVRVAMDSVWDPRRAQPRSRQLVLGSAEPLPLVDLSQVKVLGTRALGDVGALAWLAEQLDLSGLIDRTVGATRSGRGPSLGEMVVAVAVQRVCAPGPKKDLADFLGQGLPRLSCVPTGRFTGQAFHRLAKLVSERDLERVQVALARQIVDHFSLQTDVLAFDTTNFDTHIDSTTEGELARRGHAKSKRHDLRVVGLALLVSETEHVPLLYRTFPGNSSDQAVLRDCLRGLIPLQQALDREGPGGRPTSRLLVRDGGFWSPELEGVLDVAGYGSLIALPLGHKAAEQAMAHAGQRGAMKRLSGKLRHVRVARLRTQVGTLDRTLLVVESPDLLAGQKRGIAARLVKAKEELQTLARQASLGKVTLRQVQERSKKILAREFLHAFVEVDIGGTSRRPTLSFEVNPTKRRELERKRLGRRVLCTDQHRWGAERLVLAFRGQWKVEELFRRTKRGAIAPWGPSWQRNDESLRLHTFCTVLGLTLVSLVRVKCAPEQSALEMMSTLQAIEGTEIQLQTGGKGRPKKCLLVPSLSKKQSQMVEDFALGRWLPGISSTRSARR